jgi:hypothetical protein
LLANQQQRAQSKKPEVRGQSSEGRRQLAGGKAPSSKFKVGNTPEIIEKTWNLEHGTLNFIRRIVW